MNAKNANKGRPYKRVGGGGGGAAAWAQMRPCLLITGVLVLTLLIFWTAYSNILWVVTRNRLNYTSFIIDAHEHNVLPPRNLSDLIEPPVFAYGEFALDAGQQEVRWKIADVITPTVALGDIALRGPLRHEHWYVAEVQVPMGLQKDSHGRYYEGVEEIAGQLVDDIRKRPWAYYVSFEDESGYEVARDALSKGYFSNL